MLFRSSQRHPVIGRPRVEADFLRVPRLVVVGTDELAEDDDVCQQGRKSARRRERWSIDSQKMTTPQKRPMSMQSATCGRTPVSIGSEESSSSALTFSLQAIRTSGRFILPRYLRQMLGIHQVNAQTMMTHVLRPLLAGTSSTKTSGPSCGIPSAPITPSFVRRGANPAGASLSDPQTSLCSREAWT